MKMFVKKYPQSKPLINRDNLFFQRLARLPIGMFIVIVIISLIGFVMMYSAGRGNLDPWASKQIIRFIIFIPVILFVTVLDIRIWYKLSYPIYVASLSLLIIAELFGKKAMGATRWIDLGFISLQPSELMKIALVLVLAKYFHNLNIKNIKKIRYLILPSLLVIVPSIFIIKQPDLGTAMILLLLGGIIFFLAGVYIWKFITILLLAACSFPLIWQFLYEYQKKRILTFLDPEADPQGSGYNIIQSKIAIGSGGFTGKGLLKGSQSQLSFLPEHQTDFIFTMISEELGFVGAVSLMILFMIIIYYAIHIAVNSRNHFGRLLALGVASMIFLHTSINIAMVTGMLPAVGVPLPLLSYGGTIMMTALIGLGLIMNVSIHRNTIIHQNLNYL